MKRAKLVLVRHGESVYNEKNLFTGWTDIELSEQGKEEARNVGRLLKKYQIYPDICFTSWLKRAIHTAQIALRELEWEQIDSLRSYKLNERHYGAWQGEDKDEVKKEYAEETFLAVRRGFDVPPPRLDVNDSRNVWTDSKYKTMRHNLLPLCESLKDTKKRVVEYYEKVIEKHLRNNQTLLISAHGNSLRALVMHLEKISEEDVVKLEIPTGEVIIYSFEENQKIIKKEILLE